jgi:hypothetical protein
VVAGASIAFAAAEEGDRDGIMLLATAVLAGIIGPVLSDLTQGYFFASRQLVFLLPSLAILAVSGFEKLHPRRPATAGVLGLLLAGGSLVADVHYAAKPRENWELAARRLLLGTSGDGCVAVIRASREQGPEGPSDLFLNGMNGVPVRLGRYSTAAFYMFFEPSLRERLCHSWIGERRIISAASPDTAASDEAGAQAWFRARGFRASQTEEAGGTRITAWTRE